MNLEKTVKTLIDALVAIVMIVLIYQELAESAPEGNWPAVIVAMAFLALAGWFVKKVTNPLTRAFDGLFEKEK